MSDSVPVRARSQARDAIRQEQLRSERFVSFGRLVLGCAGLILTYSIRRELLPRSTVVLLAACVYAVAYSVLVLFLLRAGRFGPWMKYVSTALDVMVVTGLIWGQADGAHSYAIFKEPEFMLYYIVLGLAALRFSAPLIAVAGVGGIVGFGSLFVFAASRGVIETGTIEEAFASARVSPEIIAVQLAFLALFACLQIVVSRGHLRLLARSVASGLQAHRERREGDRVKDALSRYVAHQVADVILHRGINLAGESRKVTVLFCDVRDFSRISEKLPPQEVLAMLNDYFSVAVDVIFEQGGTLDKFIGDGMMAVFGAPVSSGRDEEMAVRSAVRIRDALRQLNAGRGARGQEPIQIGIGIHTGEVVAGNVGSQRRMEYTVVGSTVNLASRMESLNKVFGTDILISEATYREVTHLVNVERMAPTPVRGLAEPVTCYHLKSVDVADGARMGEELVRSGLMTAEQVERVLEGQRARGRPFGEVAVEMGYMDAEAVGMYLAVKAPSQQAPAEPGRRPVDRSNHDAQLDSGIPRS